MIEFISNLHIGWWFLAHALTMLVCFISLDNYNYKRTMLFANAIQEMNEKLELIELRTAKQIKTMRVLEDDEYEEDYD